jgi:hypothetical protein
MVMPSRAWLVAFVLLFNACAPFEPGERTTDEEPTATDQPVSDRPATEPTIEVPSAPAADAGSDDGGANAEPPPRPAKDDCTLIGCLLH